MFFTYIRNLILLMIGSPNNMVNIFIISVYLITVHKLSVLKQILKHKLAEKRDEELKRKQEIIKLEALEEDLPGKYVLISSDD